MRRERGCALWRTRRNALVLRAMVAKSAAGRCGNAHILEGLQFLDGTAHCERNVGQARRHDSGNNEESGWFHRDVQANICKERIGGR